MASFHIEQAEQVLWNLNLRLAHLGQGDSLALIVGQKEEETQLALLFDKVTQVKLLLQVLG